MRDFTITSIFVVLLCVSGSLFSQSTSEIPGNSVAAGNSVVQLYPNPATDYVYIRFESMNTPDVQVNIRNIIGNQVSVDAEAVSDHEVRLRVKDLAAGYYLAVIQDERTKFRGTYKFVKR